MFSWRKVSFRLRAEFPSRPRAGPTDLTGLLAMSSQVVVISFVDRRSWHRCTSNPSSKASSPKLLGSKIVDARNCKFSFFFRLTDGWSGQRDDGWWWFLLKKNFQVFVVFVGAPVTAKRRSNQPTVRRLFFLFGCRSLKVPNLLCVCLGKLSPSGAKGSQTNGKPFRKGGRS